MTSGIKPHQEDDLAPKTPTSGSSPLHPLLSFNEPTSGCLRPFALVAPTSWSLSPTHAPLEASPAMIQLLRPSHPRPPIHTTEFQPSMVCFLMLCIHRILGSSAGPGVESRVSHMQGGPHKRRSTKLLSLGLTDPLTLETQDSKGSGKLGDFAR